MWIHLPCGTRGTLDSRTIALRSNFGVKTLRAVSHHCPVTGILSYLQLVVSLQRPR